MFVSVLILYKEEVSGVVVERRQDKAIQFM
jgi:hypothetical protein